MLVNAAVPGGLLEGAPVTLAVQLRGASAPARAQHGQGRHAALLFEPVLELKVPGVHLTQVAFEKAPVAFDHVPLGHSAGATAPAGQKKPAGQRIRSAPLQYEPALPAQGKQVRRRTRLLALSAVYSSPEGEDARKTGLLKAASSPAPSPKAAAPVPAMVVTSAVSMLTERMRLPDPSAT